MFFSAVKGMLGQSNTKRDELFHERVFGFTIGALLKIEKNLDFATERGASALREALSLLIDDGDTVEAFLKRLATLLLKEEVRDYLLIGSRCFKAFDNANVEKVSRLIGRAFCDGYADVSELGEPVQVGIVFTDIVNSTQLNVTLGDDVHQLVIAHHARIVDAACGEFGGRILKNLGDGFMVAVDDPDDFVAMQRVILKCYAKESFSGAVPSYEVRIGGNFGNAISKDNDYFGSAVALAARISSKARDSGGCLAADMMPYLSDQTLLVEPEDEVMLKGFPKPFALVHFACNG